VDRPAAARIARETLVMVEEGRYTSPAGRVVSIAAAVEKAVRGTVSHPPDAPLRAPRTGVHETRFTVTRSTTLAVARRLERPLALNLASARHPGGGFLSAIAERDPARR
jgi:uncharacterized protein (TIGR02452 family)